MPWPVYSERLLASPGGIITIRYTVPGGKRLVLRNALACTWAPDTSWQVDVNGLLIYREVIQASNVSRSVDMRAVLYSGEVLSLQIITAGIAVQLHGYVFDNGLGRSAGYDAPVDEAELPPGMVLEDPA